MWLKRIEVTTYIIKGARSFFGEPTLKNFTIKHVCCEEIYGCVTSQKVSQTACERGWSMSKRLLVNCGASPRSLEPFLVVIHNPRGVEATQFPYNPLTFEMNLNSVLLLGACIVQFNLTVWNILFSEINMLHGEIIWVKLCWKLIFKLCC